MAIVRVCCRFRRGTFFGWMPWVVLANVVLACVSCNRGPIPVYPPEIHASRAAGEAITQLDTSGDGVISGEEFAGAPGLKAMLATGDTNADHALSADEIAARIKQWQSTGVGVTSFGFVVTLDGRPLEGATVTFEPEGFLGEEIKGASTTTNVDGRGGASIAPEDRPDPSTPPGMHLGIYRVRVSKQVNGRETIPSRYNSRTTLGQEVAFDVPEIVGNRVVYELRSNGRG